MANVPDALRYTSDHEYVKSTDAAGEVLVGITDYAQGELGDIVFVNLPKAGESFAAGGVFGTIEAVKAVSDLYSPLAGEVVAVNPALDADPAVVNRDPYGEGWMIRLKLKDPAALQGLMDAAAYRSHIGA
ncbi:MAG: glycine cleavage system protein GcvH [Gemmatimonadales bacterium]|nr:glycine cleavage system protein GcvH [Gemmatimonadales bacterium]